MKIDIHTHTKKVKSGDALTRNIETERFVEIINDTEVNILAITNCKLPYFSCQSKVEFSI